MSIPPSGPTFRSVNHRGWKFWLRVLAPVLAAIAGLAALRLLGPDILSQHRLAGWIRPLGPFAPLCFILFLAVRPLTLALVKSGYCELLWLPQMVIWVTSSLATPAFLARALRARL